MQLSALASPFLRITVIQAKNSYLQVVGEWKKWGHDTFMCGLDFLNLDLK